jgi:hypothetical protein
MQSHQVLIHNQETRSSNSVISFEGLADYPENLVHVDTTGKHNQLTGYNHLQECKCHRFYNRTNTKHDQLIKGAVNIPLGFKTPLDFFESVMAEYLAKQFSSLPEIHLLSLGSGKLLRELIFIAKLIQSIKKINSDVSIPPIYLHAVDPIYKKPKKFSQNEWSKSPKYLCTEEFKKIIQELGLNVTLLIYTSIDEYNKQIKPTQPTIILAIDVPFRYDSRFPLSDVKDKSFTDKKYTQEGILEETQTLSLNNSICITLTHLETNIGMYIILEKKEDNQWKKEWIHTIGNTEKVTISPPEDIQNILDEKEKYFFTTNEGLHELAKRERFKNSPLSLAAKEHDNKTIDHLLNLKDEKIVNAQTTDGYTALHFAAMRRNDTLITQLIKHGANPDIKNIHGRSPLDYYMHQVSPVDFKNNIQPDFYQKMCEKYLVDSTQSMPEFYELYHYDDDINSVFGWTRNGLRVDTSIFKISISTKPEEVKKEIKETKQAPREKTTTPLIHKPDISSLPFNVQKCKKNRNCYSDTSNLGLFSKPELTDTRQSLEILHRKPTFLPNAHSKPY